jgi:hypothetical protein
MKKTVVYVTTLILLLNTSCKKEAPEFINYRTIELRQEFNNDWSRWIIDGDSLDGYFRTEFSQSWDRWLVSYGNETGIVRTMFNNDWDRWNINATDVMIRTEFTESWNRWLISGNSLDKVVSIRTEFTDDNTRWNVFSSLNGNIAQLRTIFSEDYRRWSLRINADKSELTTQEIISVFFISVFTSSIHEQGITE